MTLPNLGSIPNMRDLRAMRPGLRLNMSDAQIREITQQGGQPPRAKAQDIKHGRRHRTREEHADDRE